MVEDTKIEIETLGFQQLISSITRSCKGQRDSCLDQVWSNVHENALSTFVKTRGSSDHCVVGVTIRIKGGEGNYLEYLCRKRSNFNLDMYRQSLKNSNWEEFYSITSLDRANNWLEEILRYIFQSECPMRKLQPNKKLKNWADRYTIKLFKQRDMAREQAKITGSDDDWKMFKQLRNKATKKVCDDNKRHFKQIYETHEKEHNTKGLYKTVHTQLGWKNSGPHKF